MAVFLLAVALSLAVLRPALAADGALSLAIETVKQGREGLEFSAHLAGTSHTITRGINWTIRTADGVDVYSGNSGTADVVTPPGDYVVDLQYGAGRLSRVVSLPEGTRLRVDFALNAGGLRIVPRAGGAPLPDGGARIRVFTLQQGQPNRSMALNATAGDILPLPEGRYRIESQVGDGNAKAVADVQIKSGRLSTLDIRHKAGIARLNFVGQPSDTVQWAIEDEAGVPVVTRDGLAAAVILAPGHYTAKADADGRVLTARFTIAAGKSRYIILGN